MRNFLLTYVAFMVAMSTMYIIIITKAVKDNIPFIGSYCSIFACAPASGVESLSQGEFAEVLCIMLASWGADGFMVSNFHKVKEKVIWLFLVSFALNSFGDV